MDYKIFGYFELISPTHSPRAARNIIRKDEDTMSNHNNCHQNPLREQNENVLHCCQDRRLQHQTIVFLMFPICEIPRLIISRTALIKVWVAFPGLCR